MRAWAAQVPGAQPLASKRHAASSLYSTAVWGERQHAGMQHCGLIHACLPGGSAQQGSNATRRHTLMTPPPPRRCAHGSK